MVNTPPSSLATCSTVSRPAASAARGSGCTDRPLEGAQQDPATLLARDRELLLNRLEIRKLEARIKKEKGLTLIPLSVYFKGPWAKLEVAVAKGLRKGDKREAIKRREAQRDIDRVGRERR